MTLFDSSQDDFFMEAALDLARQAAALGEVPVGAVVVQNGVIVGKGYNLREIGKNPLAHAELIAIHEACQTLGGWRLVRCQLFVTLEPCPMCAGAIINARIERLVFGARDPKAGSIKSVQQMFSYPYNHLPPVVEGVKEEECAQVLREFFMALREKKRRTKQENHEIV